jgi:3-(3-hydroxy-phenyl)propionate hydroxylase
MVSDGTLPLGAPPGLTPIDLAREPEAEGVVAAWMARHGVNAAIVRPDHYTFGAAADAAALQALLTQWQAR